MAIEPTKVDTRFFQNLLADKRLSQRKLAARLKLDPAAVSLMIRGKRKLSAAEAAEIAKFLGLSVEEVLFRSGNTASIPKGKTTLTGAPPTPPSTPSAPQRPMIDGVGDQLEIPVPMSDGSTAKLTVPRLMTKADAEKIAALVAAFAQN
jgi:transcriptional regulator with XRE-family HTH domain